MSILRLLLLNIVLFVLIIFSINIPKEPVKKGGTKQEKQLIDIDYNNLKYLHLEFLNPKRFEIMLFRKKENWVYNKKNINEIIKDLIEDINDLIIIRSFPVKNEDLYKYGFNNPSLSIVIRTNDNKETHILFGKQTPASKTIYCTLDKKNISIVGNIIFWDVKVFLYQLGLIDSLNAG
jgi:hypothetical protein